MVSASPLETLDATRISALSWNLYLDNQQTDTIRSSLKSSGAGIVALQEFTHLHHDAILGDAELMRQYPYRFTASGGAPGMGILSAYPILEQGKITSPQHPYSFPVLWARLDLGDNRAVTVVNAHPRPGHVSFVGRSLLPNSFDPTIRDEEIAFVRAFITPMLERGEHVLLLGDFNITEREPAYNQLVAGMHDAHAEVGLGTGHSWRPAQLMNRDIGVIRIDYLLSSKDVRPTRITTDCTPRGGDHCLLQGTFEVN
jgi:endonuclease/exonuclease/phosphatase family metal-dependent hydrolase